jgi:molecular chaperone DnaK
LQPSSKRRVGIDVRNDPLARQRLDEAAEKAKIELSTASRDRDQYPVYHLDASGPRHLLIKMTRAKLEELTAEFIDRAMAITKRAMEASPFKIATSTSYPWSAARPACPRCKQR